MPCKKLSDTPNHPALNKLFPNQPSLSLLPLLLANLPNLLLRTVKLSANLIERVFRALLKLLAYQIDSLLPPQPLVFLLHLRQPSRFIRRISSLEPPLRMSIYLLGIAIRGKRQGIEGIIDTGSVERRFSFCGRLFIELSEVETAGLLSGRFIARTFRFGWGVALFFGEDGVFLCLFTCDFGFFGVGFLSIRKAWSGWVGLCWKQGDTELLSI